MAPRFLPSSTTPIPKTSPGKRAKPPGPSELATDVDPDLLPAQPVQTKAKKAAAVTAQRVDEDLLPALPRQSGPKPQPRPQQSLPVSQPTDRLAGRFARPPRFANPRPRLSSTAADTPSRLPFAVPRKPGEEVEDLPTSLEESSHISVRDHDDDDEMLLDPDSQPDNTVLPTIGLSPHPAHPLHHPLPFSPKRRLPSTTTTPAPTRPAFIPPPTPSLPSQILPLFSPHRRGAKFLPGGLAATLQSWVIETGQAATVNPGRGLYGVAQPELRIRIEGLGDGGPPWRVEGEGRRVLLVGGEEGRELRRGDVLRVRMPWWEVEIERVVWAVGVEWRVG